MMLGSMSRPADPYVLLPQGAPQSSPRRHAPKPGLLQRARVLRQLHPGGLLRRRPLPRALRPAVPAEGGLRLHLRPPGEARARAPGRAPDLCQSRGQAGARSVSGPPFLVEAVGGRRHMAAQLGVALFVTRRVVCPSLFSEFALPRHGSPRYHSPPRSRWGAAHADLPDSSPQRARSRSCPASALGGLGLRTQQAPPSMRRPAQKHGSRSERAASFVVCLVCSPNRCSAATHAGLRMHMTRRPALHPLWEILASKCMSRRRRLRRGALRRNMEADRIGPLRSLSVVSVPPNGVLQWHMQACERTERMLRVPHHSRGRHVGRAL